MAKKKLEFFGVRMMDKLQRKDFHKTYYKILDEFAYGRIRKLIISMPPQHGKSQGSSRFLPAFMLGLNPDLKIAIGSYETTTASDFNRDVQRIIDSPEYAELFPDTRLNSSNVVTIAGAYLRNSKVFEIVNHIGSLRSVGRGSALTSKTVDIMILDDIYKGFAEANSPLVRDAAWNWYVNDVKTRLHNDSQELIVFTRWHEDDIIGRLEQSKDEQIIEAKDFSDITDVPKHAWVKLNFEAIKSNERSELDDRPKGSALWDEMHNLAKLKSNKSLDPLRFECLYQGNPETTEGLLYEEFETYTELPDSVITRANVTDTADQGTDYLCSINYVQCRKTKKIYVIDILYTQEPMEKTEGYTASMLKKDNIRESLIESNNGGRGFARAVERILKTIHGTTKIRWFGQSKNKESRILTNAATVNHNIVFPADWITRYPEFSKHVRQYKRIFAANKYDDAPDTLTMIVEKEIIRSIKRGVKRKN